MHSVTLTFPAEHLFGVQPERPPKTVQVVHPAPVDLTVSYSPGLPDNPVEICLKICLTHTVLICASLADWGTFTKCISRAIRQRRQMPGPKTDLEREEA